MITRNVRQALPYMATENILMAAVARGGNRQELHERLRIHSLAVAERMKAGAVENDLLDWLEKDPAFSGLDWSLLRNAAGSVGRSPEQVDEFIRDEIEPLRQRFAHLLNQTAELTV
jgi:adenylosuccinate lyase